MPDKCHSIVPGQKKGQLRHIWERDAITRTSFSKRVVGVAQLPCPVILLALFALHLFGEHLNETVLPGVEQTSDSSIDCHLLMLLSIHPGEPGAAGFLPYARYLDFLVTLIRGTTIRRCPSVRCYFTPRIRRSFSLLSVTQEVKLFAYPPAKLYQLAPTCAGSRFRSYSA